MYAQVIKNNMRVNLIGGESEGLPIDHAAVICIDIGDRTDVRLNMKYNAESGDFYEETPEPFNILPAQLREQAYETLTQKEDDTALIPWEGNSITVDQANKVYLEYAAEGSEKAAEIQALIIAAKTYIRELYPDA